MFIGVLIGGMISGGKLSLYSHTEEGHWLEAEHAFITNVGFVSFILFGLLYYVVPLISNRELYSLKLAKYSFILLNIGLILMIVFTAVKGLSNVSYASTFNMLGGIILTLGYLIFGYNLLRSF